MMIWEYTKEIIEWEEEEGLNVFSALYLGVHLKEAI